MSGQTQREPALFILLLLVSFASVSAVLFTPALPEITLQFDIVHSKAQISILAFLIGYTFGHLPYGPLSNRFGRKPTLCCGLILAILGSLLILFSVNHHLFITFILGRFLTALGSSSGLKISFTILGDRYRSETATQKISYLMLLFAIGPGIAIALGGLLSDHFGWISCFYFLTGYGILLLIFSLFLPETCLEKDLNALKINHIVASYIQIFKNKTLVCGALMMGAATAFGYLFAAEAPFIGINKIGLKATSYGFLNFIPALGMIIGLLSSHALADKQHPFFTIFIGAVISLFASLFMFLCFLFKIITIWTLFIPVPIIYIGLSLVFSNASSFALSQSKNKANASAVMHFINMGMSAFILFSFETFSKDFCVLLPIFFILLSSFILILRYLFLKPYSQLS